MIKISKVSTIIVIIYILIYAETWGDKHVVLYGASLVAIGGIALHWLSNNCIDLSYVPYGIWNNLIMVAYSIVTGIFVAANYSALITSCITYASFSFVCIAICYISTIEHSFDWIFNLLIVIALFSFFYMLFFGVEWTGYGKTLSRRNNPHVFAGVMSLGVFSVAFKCEKLDIREYFISGAFILMFFYGVLECGSRKYLLACGFLVAIWMMTYSLNIWRKNEKNQRVYVVVVLTACILFAVYYFLNEYQQSSTHARMLNADDAGNINRIYFYKQAFLIFQTSPLIGGGYDQFKFWSGTGGYAHSTYAEALADFGFIGSVLYFSPIIFASYRIIRKAILEKKDVKTRYKNHLMAALCLSEYFIAVGQIFFMEFFLFITWTILFYFDFSSQRAGITAAQKPYQKDNRKCKYIL